MESIRIKDKYAKEFNPEDSYGHFLEILREDWNFCNIAEAIELLKEHFSNFISLEYRNKVILIIKNPVDCIYPQYGTVAWKYSPSK